jgi:hypothetical protein
MSFQSCTKTANGLSVSCSARVGFLAKLSSILACACRMGLDGATPWVRMGTNSQWTITFGPHACLEAASGTCLELLLCCLGAVLGRPELSLALRCFSASCWGLPGAISGSSWVLQWCLLGTICGPRPRQTCSFPTVKLPKNVVLRNELP